MSQDFVFINPRKIPPRRIAPKKTRNFRRKEPPCYLPELEMDEASRREFPEFNWANEFAGQIILSNAPSQLPEEPEVFFELAEETDPLTQIIFGGHKNNYEPTTAVSQLGQPVRAVPADIYEPPAQTEEAKRAELLAELEKINEADSKLSKRIARLVSPSRVGPVRIKSQQSRISLAEIQEAIRPGQADWPTNEETEENISAPAKDWARAEDDWFQVKLSRRQQPGQLPTVRKDYQTQTEPEDLSEDSGRLKTFLAGLAIFLIPVTFGFFIFSGGPNFLKTAVASFNNKLLSTASFTLVNIEENNIFPGLIEVRNNIAAASGPVEAISYLDKFLEENSNFSWLNIFKKKVSGSDSVTLAGLEFLDQTRDELASLSAAINFKNPNRDLIEEVSFFNFWNQFFVPEKQYLVVLTDSDSARPMGGRPVSYALVKNTAGGLEVLSSGSFNDLDAASEIKIIPPAAIQTVSTAWLPSEAGWFLNFSESAGTLLDFFERTTQKKTNGLVMVSQDFLKSVSFRESLIFDVDSPNWFYGLADALSRKPAGRFVSLAEGLKDGLAAHQVQFYFKDGFLEKYATSRGWAVSTETAPRADILGVTWASLKGGGARLELVERQAEIFEDGSVMAQLNLTVRQNSGASSSYFKIYLPQSTQILKAGGFSEREKIPDFSYAGNGFTRDSRLGLVTIPEAGEVKNIELFEESGLAVVGGWIELDAGERKNLNLEYLLPFRLPRKSDFSGYQLKVVRPPQQENTPFRFSLAPDKNVKIVSLEPDGFISENSGEYQGNLAQDITLAAGLVFSRE